MDANDQLRPSTLTVTPGLNGYRVALVSGWRFEVLAEFPTADEAYIALLSARKLTKEAA